MKFATYAVLLLAMCAFGFGVYKAAGALKSDSAQVKRPTATNVEALPGTMYVAQGGAIYKLHGGTFTQITDNTGWTQPSASPDGSKLVAVQRHQNWSDVFVLDVNGRVTAQLTHFQSSMVEANHWAFQPRFSADGSHVFFAYDNTDGYNSYKVDLAIVAIRSDGSGGDVVWTTPNQYTGGDTDPIPLHNGGLVYTKYSINDKDEVHSQVWMTSAAGANGTALTQPDEDCAQPTVSFDEKSIAMICRHGQLQSTQLVMASFDATAGTLGQESVLVDGKLAATPVFSPDGKTIAFLAPVQQGGPFQLWTVPASAPPSPAGLKAITDNVGLDSTATPVWDRK